MGRVRTKNGCTNNPLVPPTDMGDYSGSTEGLESPRVPRAQGGKAEPRRQHEMTIAIGVIAANMVMLFFGFVLGQLVDVFKDYLSIILCCIF
jgi:hypothetical protein